MTSTNVAMPTFIRGCVSFALSQLSLTPTTPTPVGIFRNVAASTYDEEVDRQLAEATAAKGPGDLAELLASTGTWKVG